MLPSPFQSATCGSVLIPRSQHAVVNELSTPGAAAVDDRDLRAVPSNKRRTIDLASFGQVQKRSPVTRIRMSTW